MDIISQGRAWVGAQKESRVVGAYMVAFINEPATVQKIIFFVFYYRNYLFCCHFAILLKKK